jgi:hypothetical protein
MDVTSTAPSSLSRTYFAEAPFEIICGDALTIISSLDGISVDTVITSPPYYQQREYGDDDAKEVGRESSIDAYISSVVRVFSAIPLQPWGSIWVNIGDKREHGNLLCVPERFIIAMQSAGFCLIDKVVWAKEAIEVDGSASGQCMIEPAYGRLNGNGWEPFYRFVIDPEQAWSDTCAVRIPRRNLESTRYRPESLMRCNTSLQGRNLGNVWRIPVPRNGAGHFAAMPPSLVERPIAMTCPEFVTERGPRRRIIESVEYDEGRKSKCKLGQYTQAANEGGGTLSDEELRTKSGRQDAGREYVARYPKTTGWTHDDLPSRPGIVLDPFSGTGTAGEAAIKLGRRFIGIELYPEFAARSVARCKQAAAALAELS